MLTGTTKGVMPMKTKIVVGPESHLDHLMEDKGHDGFEILKWILDHPFELKKEDGPVLVAQISIPEQFGKRLTDIHFDVPDSECYPEKRGNREYASRVCDRAPYYSDQMGVVAGPHDSLAGQSDDAEVGYLYLYTAYFGPVAPPEPTDPSCPDHLKNQAETFWSKNALSSEKAKASK